MKIVKLIAENVKKLKAVEITPTGDLVEITGANGSGKTSVLDSIWWALGGKDKIQSVPIRTGAEKAKISLDLGKFVVERRFTANNSTITVKNADGAAYPSPQTMLDELISNLSFDPLAFARKAPREQYDELKNIAKVDFDLDGLDADNKADFERRRIANREAKELQTRAEGFSFTKPPAKELIDVDALVSQMRDAERHNAEVASRAERRAEAQIQLEKQKSALERTEAAVPGQIDRLDAVLEAEITRLRTEHASVVAQLRSNIESDRAAFLALETKITSAPPLPNKIDAAAIAEQIKEAQVINRELERRQEQRVLRNLAKAKQDEAQALSDRIEKRTEEKRKAIESAQMPVDGLSLGEGTVIFNGIPFDQASGAEQLRVSVSIAMAGNPELRVIRIRDGSLLDPNGLRLIAEMASVKDYQIWIERVDASGKVGIVMEDGMVVADHQVPTRKQPHEAALELVAPGE